MCWSSCLYLDNTYNSWIFRLPLRLWLILVLCLSLSPTEQLMVVLMVLMMLMGLMVLMVLMVVVVVVGGSAGVL